MIGVIFDSSALITCNKPPPVSDAILEIDQLLDSDIVQRVTVYLTLDILKEYETAVKPRAGKCGESSELAGSINRTWSCAGLYKNRAALNVSHGSCLQSFTSSKVLWWRGTR
jgi:hypothetical protein